MDNSGKRMDLYQTEETGSVETLFTSCDFIERVVFTASVKNGS
ncbi:hypothetical protein ACFQKF_19380 [Halalkalicoccus sp. GCM10025322]